jgi:hypothetical protein
MLQGYKLIGVSSHCRNPLGFYPFMVDEVKNITATPTTGHVKHPTQCAHHRFNDSSGETSNRVSGQLSSAVVTNELSRLAFLLLQLRGEPDLTPRRAFDEKKQCLPERTQPTGRFIQRVDAHDDKRFAAAPHSMTRQLRQLNNRQQRTRRARKPPAATNGSARRCGHFPGKQRNRNKSR